MKGKTEWKRWTKEGEREKEEIIAPGSSTDPAEGNQSWCQTGSTCIHPANGIPRGHHPGLGDTFYGLTSPYWSVSHFLCNQLSRAGCSVRPFTGTGWRTLGILGALCSSPWPPWPHPRACRVCVVLISRVDKKDVFPRKVLSQVRMATLCFSGHFSIFLTAPWRGTAAETPQGFRHARLGRAVLRPPHRQGEASLACPPPAPDAPPRTGQAERRHWPSAVAPPPRRSRARPHRGRKCQGGQRVWVRCRRCGPSAAPPAPLPLPSAPPSPLSHPCHAPAAPRRLRRPRLPRDRPRRTRPWLQALQQRLGAGLLGDQPARHPRQPQPALGREDAAVWGRDPSGRRRLQRGGQPRGGRPRRR